jgi:hypothetical protein
VAGAVDLGAHNNTNADVFGPQCLFDVNATLLESTDVEFCNYTADFHPQSTVIIFGGKGQASASSLQNEFLNTIFMAKLMHAPSNVLIVTVIVVGATVLVAAVIITVAVMMAKRARRVSKNPSVHDPLLAVHSKSGARLLAGYQKTLLIPFERLKIESSRVIGHGASGQIYQATLDGTAVAVKELVSLMYDPDEVNEFVNEAASLAAIRHPNVVGFFGISKSHTENGTRLLMVMELCDTSLHSLIIKTRKALPPDSGPGAVDRLRALESLVVPVKFTRMSPQRAPAASVFDFEASIRWRLSLATEASTALSFMFVVVLSDILALTRGAS